MLKPPLSLIIPSLDPTPDFYEMLDGLIKTCPKDIEFIISDGGGLDTTQLPKAENLRCWSEPDSGQAHAINKGIKRSSGAIIGYLNTDDLLFPNALERILYTFAQKPEAKVIYGQGVHTDENGNWIEDYPTDPWDYQKLRTKCFLCQPAVFWRREIHNEFGYFDENLHFALDYDFWLRLGKHLSFTYLEYEYLAKTKLHSLAKTIKSPQAAKLENLQVKQRHNQWIDTLSAFDYCSLRAKAKLEEQKDPPTYAVEMLKAMDEIEANFTINDLHTWKTARIQMNEMATISKIATSASNKKPIILVDVSLFQPGGVHGGIKPAIYNLLQEIHQIDRCELVIAITEPIESEIKEAIDPAIKTVLCNQNTQIEDLKNTLGLDLVFCPLPSLRFHHPEIPLIFLAPDLIHLDYPASLTDPDREYRNNLFLEAKEKADLFLTVSKFSRDRLLKAYQIPHRKVWVLPHALPSNRTKPKSQQGTRKSIHFLYPANLWEHKNHKTLLIAYKSYCRKIETPWKLVLTGHLDANDSGKIIALIETLNLGNLVTFRGFLEGDEYHQVWADAGAMVFPSNYEGFGLPLLEAMEWDVPIIAADLPSLREVADSAAYFIDQHSPEAISSALLKISTDEAVREELVLAGRERSKAFNWKDPAETFSNLACNLISRNPKLHV